MNPRLGLVLNAALADQAACEAIGLKGCVIGSVAPHLLHATCREPFAPERRAALGRGSDPSAAVACS